MCMRNSEAGCVLADQQNELKVKVADMDTRLTKVEIDVGKIRTEAHDGFEQGAEAMRAINTSVSNLAHDFGDRMNNLDKRVIAEKEKWGETLRWTVKVSVRVILAGALVAMGITMWNNIFKSETGGTIHGYPGVLFPVSENPDSGPLQEVLQTLIQQPKERKN